MLAIQHCISLCVQYSIPLRFKKITSATKFPNSLVSEVAMTSFLFPINLWIPASSVLLSQAHHSDIKSSPPSLRMCQMVKCFLEEPIIKKCMLCTSGRTQNSMSCRNWTHHAPNNNPNMIHDSCCNMLCCVLSSCRHCEICKDKRKVQLGTGC